LRDRHVDRVGAEPLAGDLERQERSGGILEKSVDQCQPGEALVGGRTGTVSLDPLLGLVEQKHDLMRGEAGYSRQVAVRENSAAMDKGGRAMIGR
jgi:hypothetical protein